MLNTITFAGRLTKDVELRQTINGNSVANFTVACDRDVKDKKTDFINCTAWRQTAEFASKYFSKGSMMIVSGRLTQEDYTDSTGNQRSRYIVVVNNIYFGGGKSESKSNEYIEYDARAVQEVDEPMIPWGSYADEGSLPF